ncbi:N-alpha-acetyltransferase 60 [Dissostichus eleginoides]|uniref:histone acetyltransferase n=1 Tax=Dissostichus eleginoides TaxID=100907 RepID=A0AAD9B871_DISEL|nr:N-alpha-acetyltransferase 60 [Dissostichus eleginoides]
MSDAVPPSALSEVQLRFLCHDDIECQAALWGLVPDRVPRLMVPGHHLQQEVLLPRGHLQRRHRGNDSGRDQRPDQSAQRGSLLLDSLKEHISTTAQDHCKAIYLHVLTTNTTAIHFYENRDFRQHHYLPYYYSIRGVLKDGFTYVLYINGGHPPWTILYPFHLGSALAGLSPCSIPQRLFRHAQALLRSLLPWSNIASKTGIQYSRTM